jgi:hypothetical protein
MVAKEVIRYGMQQHQPFSYWQKAGFLANSLCGFFGGEVCWE